MSDEAVETRGRAALAMLPGAALAAAIGGAALVVKRFVPARLALPDVLVALIIGAVVINSPAARWLGLGPRDRGRNRYGRGLDFVGKTVLRASVVLMGLRIEAHFFAPGELLTVALAIGTALPTTFFLTHALAVPLGVPRRLADLVAAGTMICGASAVNAVAPVIGARRQEQGVALATVFLFSAVALVLFRAVAGAAGLDAHQGGLWSGLAVNDLASAVAVGAQMGPGGAEMAAVSKSARVLMLAPILVLFSLARGQRAARGELGRTFLGHVPGFVVGFLVLTLARAAGDAAFGPSPAWRGLIAADRHVVAFATVMVSAGIGIHLEVQGLLAAGARAVVLGATAASAMSGLTLTLMVLGARGVEPVLGATSLAALTGSFVLFQVARRARLAASVPGEVTRRRRAAAGLPAALTGSGAHRHTSPSGEFPAS
ncbi:MAG TPA: putative sulfate exporter family transporter [Polyangia bacterium]|nr:putative sulfate exporter family transporter [Polyangia bacterium]